MKWGLVISMFAVLCSGCSFYGGVSYGPYPGSVKQRSSAKLYLAPVALASSDDDWEASAHAEPLATRLAEAQQKAVRQLDLAVATERGGDAVYELHTTVHVENFRTPWGMGFMIMGGIFLPPGLGFLYTVPLGLGDLEAWVAWKVIAPDGSTVAEASTPIEMEGQADLSTTILVKNLPFEGLIVKAARTMAASHPASSASQVAASPPEPADVSVAKAGAAAGPQAKPVKKPPPSAERAPATSSSTSASASSATSSSTSASASPSASSSTSSATTSTGNADVGKIALLPLRPKGTDATMVSVLDDVLLNELQASFGDRAELITQDDVNSVLGFEKSKELLGCDDLACTVQIAGALGVDSIIAGTVGALGRKHMLNLVWIRQRDAKIIGRSNETLGRDVEQFDAGVRRAARLIAGFANADTK